MATPTEKMALRRQVRQKRQGMPVAEHVRRSAQIVRNLLDAPFWEGVECVHSFLALERANEPDVMQALAALHAKGVRLVVPMAELPAPGMSHWEYVPGEPTDADPWGVQVPSSRRAATVGDIDLVLVPMLAVDRGGFRLGYGKGYYDAFLSSLAALKVGICFSDEVVAEVPHEAHDVPVDWVVTDAGVWATARGATIPGI